MAVDISVPKSKELSWLLIRGRFKTRALSPNTTYEVAFVVKLDRNATGCMHAVTLKLELPDETKQTDTKSLTWQPVDQRMNLRAGEFVMGPKTVGTIYFALHGVESHREETSLILEGVLIHPKDEAKQ
ncbi:hypothetical protein BT93_J1977 [Corymbia citriodora subsp. variegata]|nr:hypothetical protein BT93_J1977 [Corymbia citriodora subsp. variegata]